MELFTPEWSAFPALDESTWYQLIEKELKGKALTGLDWAITSELKGRPAYHHPEDPYLGPLVNGRHSSDWMITEWVEPGSSARSNHLAVQSLTGGAQALVFTDVNLADIEPLTEGVWLDLARVFWQLDPAISATAFAETLAGLPPSRKSSPPEGDLLGGFIAPTPVEDHLVMTDRFPQWQSVIAEVGSTEDAVLELSGLLSHVKSWLDHPLASAEIAGSVLIRFEVGTSYLVEIARIRAWHILWHHLMRSYGWPEEIPCRILATISPDPDQSWETTYIASTTRALSAIFGGVDYLAIRPPGIDRPAFGHRIARNIQHLMKEEAHLHRVIDPLAGSYAIETITLDLAERAWSTL